MTLRWTSVSQTSEKYFQGGGMMTPGLLQFRFPEDFRKQTRYGRWIADLGTDVTEIPGVKKWDYPVFRG